MFLIASTDLADHDEVGGCRVFFKHLDHIAERQTKHGVAADADDGRLPEPCRRQR
jgi:hypothetical protein